MSCEFRGFDALTNSLVNQRDEHSFTLHFSHTTTKVYLMSVSICISRTYHRTFNLYSAFAYVLRIPGKLRTSSGQVFMMNAHTYPTITSMVIAILGYTSPLQSRSLQWSSYFKTPTILLLAESVSLPCTKRFACFVLWFLKSLLLLTV